MKNIKWCYEKITFFIESLKFIKFVELFVAICSFILDQSIN